MSIRGIGLGTALLLGSLAVSACTTTQSATVPPGTQAPLSGDLRVTVNPAQPFAVSIANTAPQPMVEGEKNAFSLQSQRTGYAQLYLLRASGTALVVAENLPVRSHELRVYPGATEGFDLRAQPPAGNDTALLVVTTEPFTAGLAPATVPALSGPAVSPLTRNAFVDRLGAALGQLHPDTWNSASTPVQVMIRK